MSNIQGAIFKLRSQISST